MFLRFLAMLLALLAACGGTGSGGNPPPGEDFATATAVRITVPFNGAVLAPRFEVIYEAGADVAAVRLDVDGAEAARDAVDPDRGGGSMDLDLATGRHGLRLVGLDADGAELSEHALTIRVEDGAASQVTITSPQDGESVDSPVHVAVTASEDVETVELYADDLLLDAGEPGQVLTAELDPGTWTLEARGLADGETVATDAITVEVAAGTHPEDASFNDVVLDIIATYPTDGSYGYYWPSDGDWLGTTRDIWYRDELVAEGDPEHRSYCVGLTWEVFMRAWERVDAETGGDGTINGMSVADLDEFRTDWYIRELYGNGNQDAVENYGIGERITDWDDVRPGDIVQFWRHSGSGHNVYFLDWETDSDGTIIGIHYWSTQSSTDGIGTNSEYFGADGSSIDPSRTYFARVWMPDAWVPWF